MRPLSGEVNMLIFMYNARQCQTQTHNLKQACLTFSANKVESGIRVRLPHVVFVKWMHLSKHATVIDQRMPLIEGSNAQEKDFARAA
jgi:hypothetical protein